MPGQRRSHWDIDLRYDYEAGPALETRDHPLTAIGRPLGRPTNGKKHIL